MKIDDLQQPHDIVSAVDSMEDAGWKVRRRERDMWLVELTKGRMCVSIEGHRMSYPRQMNRTVRITLAGCEFSKLRSPASDPELMVMHLNRVDIIMSAANAIEDGFEGVWRPNWPRPMYTYYGAMWCCVFFDHSVDIFKDDEPISVPYDHDIANGVIHAATEMGWPKKGM